jgi:predicted Zn finger-like uncharacterized protein
MYTTCARCDTQLTVTVTGLRTGHGFVRCSRCGDVFNALPTLEDDGEGSYSASSTGSRPALTLPEDAQAAQQAGAEDPAESELVSTGTFQTIVLEGEAVLETEEVLPETELDDRIQEIAVQIESAPDPESTEHPTFELDEGELDRHELEHAVTPTDAVMHDDAVKSAVEPEHAPDPEALLGKAADEGGTGGRAKLIGVITLPLILAATLVHLFRQDLLEQPGIGAALAATYRALHLPLEPRWDISAYEVRQLGAEVTEGDTPRILVRASVHNRAVRAQPVPLLRVALQDRFGQQLTSRVVAPGEYLRDPATTSLNPDQRRDVSFTLPDPGRGAVGFEIDACLRDAGGLLRCSTDQVSR